MINKPIHTDNAPKAIGTYSQAIVANGFVFCSGQVGRVPNKEGQPLAEGGVGAQARQVFENLKAVLEAAGSNLSNIVKTTVFLMDMSDFPEVSKVFAEYLVDIKPARTTLAITQLPKGDLLEQPLVEIEAIAVIPE